MTAIMRVRTAGFCMGVGLALRSLDQALVARKSACSGGRLVMFGPIIHNPQVLLGYIAQGVVQVDSLDEIRPGDTVVIRAHGIPRSDEARLLSLGTIIVDATCPKVKQAQLAIGKATMDGSPLYLFGEAEHPEVQGLISYAAGPCHVFGNLKELQSMSSKFGQRAVLAAQTTQDLLEFTAIGKWLESRLQVSVLSTICDATQKRQQETQFVAGHVQAMIVVGGRSSGNTRRLVEMVRSCGVPVWHIERADELNLAEFAPFNAIGITAGASTPRQLVDEVQQLLEQGMHIF